MFVKVMIVDEDLSGLDEFMFWASSIRLQLTYSVFFTLNENQVPLKVD